jgi:hypothetical protein
MMIFKVFEKFGIDLQQHCSGDFGDFKTYELNLGDFDSLKYAENVDWGCMKVIYSKGLYSIIGYLPSINFNGIKTMLITYTNTNVLRYGQNVKTIKIIDEKQITEKNFDRVVTNVKHFLNEFDKHEIKIQQFLSTLNLDDFRNKVITLSNEIKEKITALENYKEKFYKNVKSQLSVTKDF